MTEQAGTITGVRHCISWWDATAQGGLLRPLADLFDGDTFVLAIDGWDCEKHRPTFSISPAEGDALKKRATSVFTGGRLVQSATVG